jgi:subtilase family serine protease
MVNGTAVDEIKDGDAVNITVNITNIGIKAADNFTVSFYVDNVEIGSSHVSSLLPNESINISMDWNASLGSHWISIEAVESWIEKEIYVCAAELSGNISWDPPKPLDEDIVTINATITNSGCIPAEEFMVLMFYDYTPERFCSSIDMIGQSPMWINKNVYYGGAEWIYVYIAWHTDLDAGDLVITDKNGTEVRPDKSGFVLVRGDTVNVDARTRGDNAFEIQFYPDCAGNTSKVEGLDAGQRTNISLVKQVTSFNHTITLIIDPEDNVLENNETDNTISATMYVTPTRDFVVMNVTAETNLSDTDTTMITATVANIGIRNGTTNVSFIDYERERRTYPYWFGEHIAGDADGRYRPPYAPVDPPDMSTVIHRPGADAIEIDLTYGAYCNDPPLGEVWVCDGTGKTVWHVMAGVGVNRVGTTIVFVEGDTATIHRYGASYYYPSEYTTIHELNRTEVTLNATDTWNESRTLTSIWNASTGDHTITIIADPDDEIGEIDELNNNKSIPIHVGASRDPAIINLTNTPLNPSDGDDVAITAEVRNNGNKTANFTVDFWENTSKRYETDSSHISVPGASFVNIHLKYIREQLFIPVHECVPIDDIWLDGSIGDTLETGTDGAYQTVCGMIACPGHDWYDHVDRIQYMKLLNRTPVSLAPNETINVTAIWEKMSIKDDPDYSVIVIVDPEDEIDEINESNNEMECEIVMKYPDFEIGRFESPTKMRDARVTIRNTGIGDADDVNVTFELSRREECEGCASASPGYHPIPPGGHDGASDVRVHFDRIRMKDNGKIRILDKRGTSYATYRENADDFWSPWVEHDRVRVGCSRAYFKIDMYEWGDVEEDEIDHLGGGCSDAREIKMEEWEWEYTEPMNLTVRVDPDDEFLEMDEENNEETVIVYKDLAADGIRFDDPIDSKLSLSVAEFKVNVMIGNVETLGDDGMALPISNFNVTLEFRYRDNQTPIFNVTEHVNEALEVGDFIDVPFTFESDRFNGTYGNLTVRAVADSSNDICESNDLYPLEENEDRWGEWNNNHTRDVYIHERSGYAGGGDLVNIAQGEVNGRVVYTIGDSSRLGSGSISADGSVSTLTVTFDDTIPDGAEVEFARLYLYVDSGSEPGNRGIARPIEADMEFNRHKIQTDREYTDISVASHWNVTYGLYCYDVTDIDIEKENVAVATRISPYDGNYWFGIAAIGLLVVYVDEDEPLTKYWINEGTDVMMPDITTGLSFEDCIVTAEFDGVEREGPDGVNATLMTILSLVGGRTLQEGANGEGDALKFNGYKIGTLINHEDRSHWGYQQSAIAMTDNKWESVTDDLKRGNNLAEIQSKGNFIVPANAFLRLIFPPDLNVINLTAPASTVVGAHHSINTTIRNDGRSDAHDFNVTFHIDGNQMIRIPHLDLAAGENMTIHLYNWTPMLLMHVYNLTAAADVLSGEDWTEIEIDNNAMTKRVPIEEGGFGNQTGPRGIGGGSNPTGGEYTEPITGRVMRGIKEFLSGGGGGGAGMFSLTEWIMKGAVWLVLLFFVCAGYRMEQRSYGRVGVGLGSRI